MADLQSNISLKELRDTISAWLKGYLDKDSFQWFEQTGTDLWKGAEDWKFFTSFSKVPRHTGKESLNLSDEEIRLANSIRTGWKPSTWQIGQLGRAFVLLSVANREKEEFLELLQKTYETSDMGEAEALFKSLAILPYPEDLKAWAAEGIRTNMTSVFNAVAHYNPYPADYLNDDAWNQMVLKALFVETPLYLIQGIDKRANKKLAKMLIDYAHERWAADRDVSPELWRPVGPVADAKMVEDLRKALNSSSELQQQAALLALSQSPSDQAQKVFQQYTEDKEINEKHDVSWDSIGIQFNNSKN